MSELYRFSPPEVKIRTHLCTLSKSPPHRRHPSPLRFLHLIEFPANRRTQLADHARQTWQAWEPGA
jgi:hypothetical protein